MRRKVSSTHGPEKEWSTPDEFREQLKRLWDRGELLRLGLQEESAFPLRLRFRGPTSREITEQFDAVRQWICRLNEERKAAVGFGYDVIVEEINHRTLGVNLLPVGVTIATLSDALKMLRKQREYGRFLAARTMIVETVQGLAGWVMQHPHKVIEHGEDWALILRVVQWFSANPQSKLYLRQLEIQGVDTKFIETRASLIHELLTVLSADRDTETAAKLSSGSALPGIQTTPSLVRFRLLDETMRVHGLSDMTVPAAEFAQLTLEVDTVFVCENLVNVLTFPARAKSVVVFAKGFAVEQLFAARWMQNARLYYWGDIDTHGYVMLDWFRRHFSTVQSLLMDRETLLSHRAMWVHEPKQSTAVPTMLTAEEKQVFDELRAGTHGHHVRLEQERINYASVRRALDGV